MNAFIVLFLILYYPITHCMPNYPVRFHQTRPTLARITEIISKKQKGAYLRFGDGDVNLALNRSDLKQTPNACLAREMREAFVINGLTVLKALPLHCKEFDGLEEGMFPGNHEGTIDACTQLLKDVEPFWPECTDIYSPVALHFCATNHTTNALHFLKFLRQQAPCILVGNKYIPEHIRTALFGPNCSFVPTPDSNSYSEIDQIERVCKNMLAHAQKKGEYVVIITAMGCSGRALQKRLWHTTENTFLFDFGSLMDALCGWNTRAWIELSGFNEHTFLAKLSRNVHTVYTAALIETDYQMRKTEYEQSLTQLIHYGCIPYIIESQSSNLPTFFDQYTTRTIYTHTNNLFLRNKGVNEAQSIIAALDQLPFADTDMVIKLTGRYHFTSDEFFKLVHGNPHIDAFVKLDAQGQLFTGCFALSFDHFKRALLGLDLDAMEKNMINIEQEFASYIHTHIPPDKIMHVSSLDLTAPIFGTGTRHILHL